MPPLIETRSWQLNEKEVAAGLEEARRRQVVQRLWNKDFTLWKSEDREISNRLGWLQAPETAVRSLTSWRKLAAEVNDRGIKRVLLLGMGGSSLAPEVFSAVFGPKPGRPELAVLDSTVPETVGHFQKSLIPENTLFLVSSKSGTTLETMSLCRFFFTWMEDRLGTGRAGGHFLAITDPETPLEETARRRGFRAVLSGEPDIGGRFSVYSAFGLFPAALLGLDIEELLRRARDMARLCREEGGGAANPGLYLGTTLGRLASSGVDKLMLLLSPGVESFGGWLEQLIAESTGKEGRGILPVRDEQPSDDNLGREDGLWLVFRLKGDLALEEHLARIDRAGRPCLVLNLESPSDLAAQFFLWETAAAVAGWSLGINPFDQPDVAAAKKNSDEMLEHFRSLGRFPEGKNGFLDEVRAAPAVRTLIDRGRPGDYISLQAFLAPGPETGRCLREITDVLRSRTRLAATWGYGPRFLHSTGQLHKGDAGRGLFIQVTAEDAEDLPLPEDAAESLRGGLSFGAIKEAQARGDFQALRKTGRRAIRIRLSGGVVQGLEKILAGLRG